MKYNFTMQYIFNGINCAAKKETRPQRGTQDASEK
jgi:hypothetical protein